MEEDEKGEWGSEICQARVGERWKGEGKKERDGTGR